MTAPCHTPMHAKKPTNMFLTMLDSSLQYSSRGCTQRTRRVEIHVTAAAAAAADDDDADAVPAH